MNHEILKQIIFDQHRVIQNTATIERDYTFEEKANYILVGLRRSGKSTLLYNKVFELINSGVSWSQIIYINFEDERLAEFSIEDFNDIVMTASELSSDKSYYFMDEIQNIDGWEKFARRMADAKEFLYITGSNAKMLSSEMEAKLGGRYLSTKIMTYSFPEYLNALNIQHDESAIYTSNLNGQIRASAIEYLSNGAFPESVDYKEKRTYVENIYNKVLLGDIAARYAIRNIQALRVMMKKIAETITSEISYSKLTNTINSIGFKISKDSVINYISYAEEAYLLFKTQNYVSKLSEKESTPRFYFYDNGLLNLFLINKKSLLLENVVALCLKRRFSDDMYYFKSSKTGIDLDFYLPEQSMAIQVSYTLNPEDYERETTSLIKLAKDTSLGVKKLLIVTMEDDQRTIEIDDFSIDVLPLYLFLLGL